MNKFDKLFNLVMESLDSSSYDYQLLDRLKSDCEYFLGEGQRNVDVLWTKDITEQINKMKEIWESLEEKPEWLTWEDILNYEEQMLNND